MNGKPFAKRVLGSDSNDGKERAVTVALPASGGLEPGKIMLAVPGRADSVRIVRSVTRSWAANVGFLLDEIEELCLAIDEAFSGLISTRPVPERITVRISSDDGAVEITASRDAETELWPPVSAQTALIQRVLETLIDEVQFERTADGPSIRMVKRRTQSVP
jgi:anti-sigma regulatory factor (Ser/Thr protein kinase)